MHETALMRNLLAIVDRAARDGGGSPVRVIHVRIGEMAGVSEDALRFAFDVMARGTAADGAALEIERIPLTVGCTRCGTRSHPDDFVFVCPACGCSEIEVLEGREMEVDHILVDETETRAGGAGASQ